jgi:transmembrane sensor
VSYDQAHTADPASVDSETQLAWRHGWLNYYRTPMADVIKDLSRYYPGRIVVLNDQLASKKSAAASPATTHRQCWRH